MSGTQDKNQSISFQGKPRFFNKKKDTDPVPSGGRDFAFRSKNAGDQGSDSGQKRQPYDRNMEDGGRGKHGGGGSHPKGGKSGFQKGPDQNNRSSFSSASQANNSKMDASD